MDFFDLLKSRRSIRLYQKRAIEEEKLEKILAAANTAPSAGNLQAFEIFVIQKEKQKQALARACADQDFVATAPLVLVFCTHPQRSAVKYGQRGRKLYSLQDATIAAAYAQLAAHNLGLGACWVGAFDEEAILSLLGQPAGLWPVVVLPLGYPAEKPPPSSRRRLTNLVHHP